MAFGRPFLVPLGPDKAGDERVNQVLFEGACDLGMRQDLGLCPGQPALVTAAPATAPAATPAAVPQPPQAQQPTPP
jgi:hypothetical protein